VSTTCSSTPVIGTGFFSHGGKFAFPRSYIQTLRIGWVVNDITQADNVFTGGGTFVPPTAWKVVVRPQLFDWNSNCYTLDFVVCESYYLRLLTGEKIPAPWAIVFQNNPTTFNPELLIYNPDGSPTFQIDATYPPAPPGYWLPS
jgi:hypothetical protein